jgi:hypothetical protein
MHLKLYHASNFQYKVVLYIVPQPSMMYMHQLRQSFPVTLHITRRY